jgi:acetyl-CoA acetyltransferase
MGGLAREVEIVGIATTQFGKHLERSLASLAQEAAAGALTDAGLTASDVESVVVANAAEGVLTGQEMIRGQVALDGSDLAGLPIINVENACASGSTAVHLAALMVASGQYDCVLALGVEKLFHPDRDRSFAAIRAGVNQSLDLRSVSTEGSVMMGCYAAEAKSYMAEFGPIDHALVAVSVKNRAYASTNPNAQFRASITAEDVHSSRLVADPLRLLMCAPMTDGASAVVVRAASMHRTPRAVKIESTKGAGYERNGQVVKRAVQGVYRASGIRPADVKVWQLHDACSFAEIAQYELVGIAASGAGVAAALEGRTGPGGDAPVNTDGGLLSRGHPLGATGIAQIAYVA